MHLLLVEDEAALAAATRMGLEAAGFTVDVVGDGDTGYQAALEQRHDLIILDILLPGRNGFALCRDIRNAEVWTPIIMLTAKSGAYDEAEALELGADDFLSKPFEPVVLVARLGALARRGRAAVSSNGAADSLHVDLEANQVVYGGVTASLSPREAQLAAAIADGDGDPVSKEVLLTKIWGGRGDANTVEVYVGYLRRKLRGAFGNRVRVDTVRWAGYRLITEP